MNPTPTPAGGQSVASGQANAAPDRETAGEGSPTSVMFHKASDEAAEGEREPVDWLIQGMLAKGSITELDARVKAGKTTLALAMIADAHSGVPLLALKTRRFRSIWLTEERRPTLRTAIRRRGLAIDDLLIVYRSETRHLTWPAVMMQVQTQCLLEKVEAVVVDTISSWANLAGEDENASGRALEAMRPLESTAALGVAVLMIRHDRKSGGELGDSGRGSSASSGASDIVLQLKRANTEGHDSRRILAGVGRFDDTPEQLVIELGEDGRYHSLGSSSAVERDATRDWLLQHLPTDLEPLTELQILQKAGPSHSRGTVRRVLAQLVKEGKVVRDQLKITGQKGVVPFQYWLVNCDHP